MSVSFKADWVIYTAVMYLQIKSIAEDKLVRKEIHRQNRFSGQALSPVMAICRTQDKRAPLVSQHLTGKGQASKTGSFPSSAYFFFLIQFLVSSEKKG